MEQMLYHASVLTPDKVIENGDVVISGEGQLAYVGDIENAPAVAGPQTDLQGHTVMPGFIDMHVHGGNGIRFDLSGEIATDLLAYAEWVVSREVTGFVCSIGGAQTKAALIQRVGAFANALKASGQGAETLGLHLEGPFLNREKRGAINPQQSRGRGPAKSRTRVDPPGDNSARALRCARDGGVVSKGRDRGCAGAQQRRLRNGPRRPPGQFHPRHSRL